MRPLAALAVTLLVLASGCLEAKSSGKTSTTDAADEPQASDKPSKGKPGGKNPPPEPTPERPPRAWPPIDEAVLRPGVRVEIPAGPGESALCTSNFLYESPHNESLYLGLAAHCVDNIDVGDNVSIDGADKPGRLAYSSWKALGVEAECFEGNPACDMDFALIEIDAADHERAHPAVLHFGGPAALGNASTLAAGDQVFTYGNNWPRGEVEPLNWHEGIVTLRQKGYVFYIETATPGIPGDSGSGVLSKNGEAVGILTTICILGGGLPYNCAAQNGVVALDDALQVAKDEAGFDVTLATWALADDGILPPIALRQA